MNKGKPHFDFKSFNKRNAAGLVDLPLFTVWLEHEGVQENVNGGVYTYGGLDTTNCLDVIAYEPLTSATYFQFKMSGFKAGSYSSSKGWNVSRSSFIIRQFFVHHFESWTLF